MAFILGYLVIGVGVFAVPTLKLAFRLVRRYGNLWIMVWGGDICSLATMRTYPHPRGIAAGAAMVFNSIGIVFGAAVIVASIVNLLFPSFEVDALVAKNAPFIFLWPCVCEPATIYMAPLTAVYEILARYTGTSLEPSRLFIGAWRLR